MSMNIDELAEQVVSLAESQAQIVRALSNTRTPSKAHLQGGGRSEYGSTEDGAFIRAIFDARSVDTASQAAGKAALEAMGCGYQEYDGKATIGLTGTTGGYITPNPVVTKLVEISTPLNPYRELLNVVSETAAPGIAIPVEAAAPTRAEVVAWGTQKPNVDITYAQYAATMWTIGRIHDVSNQLLRWSAGAAQADVVSRLGRSFALGEAYYILQGAGTTEPVGLLTALASAGTFDTNKGAATTTVATSIAGTIISAIQTLGLRAVKADAVVLDVTSYWKAMVEATTSFSVMGSLAGHAVSPITLEDGPKFFGLPLIADPNMPLNTGIVGAFKSATLYTGLGYRIDTSDQAGTRWDYNLTGFRGEEEIAFNATPYVVAGKFQRLTNLNT